MSKTMMGNGLITVGEDTPLPKRDRNDYYPTSWGAIEAALLSEPRFPTDKKGFRPKYNVGDIGAGSGRWGQVFRHKHRDSSKVDIRLHGFELQEPKAENREEWKKVINQYDRWHVGDVITQLCEVAQTQGKFSFLFGNPAFYLFGEKYVGKFFRAMHEALDNTGRLILFARSVILESDVRYREVYSWWRPSVQLIFTNRVSFYPEGHPRCGDTNATAHSIFIWDKTDYIADPKIKWISTVNDNKYTGPHKGTNTWQDMLRLGLINEEDSDDGTN